MDHTGLRGCLLHHWPGFSLGRQEMEEEGRTIINVWHWMSSSVFSMWSSVSVSSVLSMWNHLNHQMLSFRCRCLSLHHRHNYHHDYHHCSHHHHHHHCGYAGGGRVRGHPHGARPEQDRPHLTKRDQPVSEKLSVLHFPHEKRSPLTEPVSGKMRKSLPPSVGWSFIEPRWKKTSMSVLSSNTSLRTMSTRWSWFVMVMGDPSIAKYYISVLYGMWNMINIKTFQYE